ncbi:uncharacterized protein LOC125227616 isoform X2 [Leguminivora glycinivorella]|uniref:uncharacterized protein LOC125227616 isoform X2 n=1 Tax=Leguminivora glycinivorella TaxID=1035111 RepID=UPI00200EF220|nr:uncharacterized protein LOC125227616 isoform X2 [Leguminivora glycinivorella]
MLKGCKEKNHSIAGVLVRVCNYNQKGQNGRPIVTELDDFSPLNVTCTDGCPGGGSLTYTQYCHYTKK